MKPTDNLITEHKEICELLNIMSVIAENIKSKDVFYPNDVDEIIDSMIILLDKSHHGKEEDVFYPELILSGILKEKAPLSINNNEHMLAKRYLNEISSCVVNCKIGIDFSGELLADSLANCVDVIHNHIQREEEIVFPLANEAFSIEKQNEIYKKFEDIEQKNIRHNFNDHLNKLVNNLNNKYLVKAFERLV
jgi:hemerythrin-like domain-containing protein